MTTSTRSCWSPSASSTTTRSLTANSPIRWPPHPNRHRRRPHRRPRRISPHSASRGCRRARDASRSASRATSPCRATARASCSCAAAAAPIPSTACGSSTRPPVRSASPRTPTNWCSTQTSTPAPCHPRNEARRERTREAAGGITSFAIATDATLAAFALGGRSFVSDLDVGEASELPVAGGVFDTRPDPTASRVAYVNGPALCVASLWHVAGDAGGHGDTESDTVSWGSAVGS